MEIGYIKTDIEFCTDWVTTNLKSRPEGRCVTVVSDVYNQYVLSCPMEPVGAKSFYKTVRKMFPKLEFSQVRREGKRVKSYTNIVMEASAEEPPESVSSLREIYDSLHAMYDMFLYADTLKIVVPSRVLCNGRKVCKALTMKSSGAVTCNVLDKDIKLSSLGITDVIPLTVSSVHGLYRAVESLKFCFGITSKDALPSVKCWCVEGDENFLRISRHSTLCEQLLPVLGNKNTCCKCINFRKIVARKESQTVASLAPSSNGTVSIITDTPRSTHQQPPTSMCESTDVLTDDDSDHEPEVQTKQDKKLDDQKEDLLGELKSVLDKMQLPDITKDLMVNQARNANMKHPQLRRWDSSIIHVCLSWWACNPKTYEWWREKVAVLPHPATLRGYKNCLQQRTGLHDDMLSWMRREADRHDLEAEDRRGGIIIDEMSIQDDLRVIHRGCSTYYSGLIEMTPQADGLYTLRKGGSNVVLASHVLQFVFLGNNGFRWPFAHFATKEAQAPELYLMFMDAVDKLQEWGFQTEYLCLDGAVANRNFVNIIKSSEGCFTRSIVNPDTEISIIMDIKHGVKKLRNSILSSGDRSFHKRLLRPLHVGPYEIRWEHWIHAFEWDWEHHSLPIYQRLSRDHLFLDCKSKMRNHLAEDVLNGDMLRLMQDFKAHLGDDGDHLSGTVALLEQTSVLVAFASDFRYIVGGDDPRLHQLRDVLKWFQRWEFAVSLSTMPTVQKNKSLMTRQARDDLESTVLGLSHLCTRHFRNSNRSLCPARLNSDVIENVFCQQRALQHGSNDNPDIYQYGSGISTLILTQPPLSRKRNSAGSVVPPNFDVKKAKKVSCIRI